MSILIKELSKNKYEIIVHSNTSTQHIVTLTDIFYQKITNAKVTKKELLDFSFKFLLERESNTSILSFFELTIITRYFPEYEVSIKKWCGF
jgi:hypothetical protein